MGAVIPIIREYSDEDTGVIQVKSQANSFFKLKNVAIHIDAAPVTPEDLTISVDKGTGANFDTLIFKAANLAAQDVYYEPDMDTVYNRGDEIQVDYPNSDGNNVAVTIVVEIL